MFVESAMRTSMNYGHIIRDSVRARPDAEALVYGGVRLTYGELDRRCNRVANGLDALGIGAGDHVAVLVKNDPRFVECMLGSLRAGAVVTPATTRAHTDTLAHILGDCEARVLFASADFAGEAPRLGREVAGLEHVFLMDARAEGAADYDAWLANQPAHEVDRPVADSDIALLPYTSGSTGKPKGVLLSHGAVAWMTRAVRKGLLLDETERCLLAVPMFHANGMFCGFMPTLAAGGTVVILHDFDAKEAIAAIGRERCTYTTGVPAMYKLMLREETLLAATDVSSLSFVDCGSADVPDELLSAFQARFGAPMLETYGLTECGPIFNNPRWGINKRGTTGLPHLGAEARIVDPADPARVLAVGEVGEILIKSPSNASGYHKLPAVTAERFLAGGWLRTGDLGRLDADGYLEIVGRQDDMMKVGGETLYPKEVENVLIAHPDVADVAVVPRPDATKGTVPVAFVVEKVKGRITPQALKQYFLAHGPGWAHPRAIHIVAELPLTAAKKVDRARLKEIASEGAR